MHSREEKARMQLIIDKFNRLSMISQPDNIALLISRRKLHNSQWVVGMGTPVNGSSVPQIRLSGKIELISSDRPDISITKRRSIWIQ